jgi:hypothetical protein
MSQLVYHQETDPVPTAFKAGWAPGPVWMDAENLVPTDSVPTLFRPQQIAILIMPSQPTLSCLYDNECLNVVF